ncbi:DUF4097 family beta strand repeat-containing protein [Anaerococcus rubeinfantis]|uniref:DUF4097 family beta strand repeat-containing protein n=1 Tax=Anaerococcus rubeinfantis TaxID=1720199 RepID=UPI00073E2A58|nr:DUF4097 family beta strand repeat-containing protein [Anaerococcus rubeinfantis]
MSKNKKNNSFKLDKKQIAIGFFAIIVLVLIFFLSRNIDFANKEGKSSKEINENSYNSSKIMRVDLDDLKTINLDLKTCDVRIQESSTNPYVEYTNLYKDDYSYEVKSKYKDGNLKLSSDIKGKELYMKNKIQIVRIFLPKNKKIDSIKLKLGAGDVKVTNLISDDVDFDLESGNVSFENSKISGSVANNAGSILIKKSELKNSDLNTKTGNIIVTDTKLQADEKMQSQNGDIVIKTKDPIKSFNINARLDVGNFVLGNVSYRNILDGYTSGKNKKKSLDLRTNVGDILFNQSDENAIKEEEFINVSSPDSNENSDSNEDNINTNEENN